MLLWARQVRGSVRSVLERGSLAAIVVVAVAVAVASASSHPIAIAIAIAKKNPFSFVSAPPARFPFLGGGPCFCSLIF